MHLNRTLRHHLHVLCATAFTFLSLCTAQADDLQLIFQKVSDDLATIPYLSSTGDRERGIAYNPATGHILIASRSTVNPGGEIYILDGQTGDLLGTMSVGDRSIVTGGTFHLSALAIADDGVIYAANLTTSTVTPDFRIYRGESETAEPTLAYSGVPDDTSTVLRWGDSFDVRGSGTDTQFIAGGGSGATIGALFTTTDGINFTAKKITNIAANSIAFGAGNTVWVKRSGVALNQVSFDPTTGVGTVIRTVPTSIVPGTAVPIGVNVESNYLAAITINTATDDLRLFDISNLAEIAVVDQEVFPANNANANAAGFIDITDGIVAAVNANNGLMVFRIRQFPSPPNFTTQPPAAISFVEGGFGSIVANVSGARPITFQWQQDGVNVTRGTNSTLPFTNITQLDAGAYTLIASNAAASVTSTLSTVTITPSVRSQRATNLFTLRPGTRPYLNADNTDRGLAYNAPSNHVLVVTRVPPVDIYVLDGDTGADLWKMQTPTDVIPTGASTPAGFRLNMIGVADDGVVYAMNLTTGAGETDANALRIYRWENDGASTVPVEVYRGAPVAGRRFGDTFDVRGSGNDTQILVSSVNTGAVEPDFISVIFTTTDGGLTFTPNVITTLGVDDDAGRTGMGFAGTNTVWAKYSNQPLRLMDFDLTTGAGNLLQSFDVPGATAVGGSSNLVAVVTLENPDNLRIFELNAARDQVTLIDQEFFGTDNANANGTGSVDFGKDRLYALDTNNGLIALKLTAGDSTPKTAATFSAVSGTQNSFTFTITGTPNSTHRVESTTDFDNWTEVQTVTIEPDGSNTVTLTTTGNFRFYRAVAQ